MKRPFLKILRARTSLYLDMQIKRHMKIGYSLLLRAPCVDGTWLAAMRRRRLVIIMPRKVA